MSLPSGVDWALSMSCWVTLRWAEGEGRDHETDGPGPPPPPPIGPKGDGSEGERSIEKERCFPPPPIDPKLPISSSRPTSSFILRSEMHTKVKIKIILPISFLFWICSVESLIPTFRHGVLCTGTSYFSNVGIFGDNDSLSLLLGRVSSPVSLWWRWGAQSPWGRIKRC